MKKCRTKSRKRYVLDVLRSITLITFVATNNFICFWSQKKRNTDIEIKAKDGKTMQLSMFTFGWYDHQEIMEGLEMH